MTHIKHCGVKGAGCWCDGNSFSVAGQGIQDGPCVFCHAEEFGLHLVGYGETKKFQEGAEIDQCCMSRS